MRSSTSSSEVRTIVAFGLTFLGLFASWEAVLRHRSGAMVDVPIHAPAREARAGGDREWLIFGNCLMLTGLSPRLIEQQLEPDDRRVVLNIAWHEQSPMAFFAYLRAANRYPEVVVTNVSSWLNGTNFEQDAAMIAKADPLGVRRAGAQGPSETPAASAATGDEQAFHGGDPGNGRFQRETEAALSKTAATWSRALGHRYHLFDYAFFLGVLGTTADLDGALYQLNMQSWFRVAGSETDGKGFLGLQIRYRDDWPGGLERMADRSLQRLRLSHLLTPRYWALLEEDVRDFRSHGTRVLFVRMPEHPRIRAFNDETYAIDDRLRGLEARTGAEYLDLSRLGPADGVHLFDAVHPDAPSAEAISRAVGAKLRAPAAAPAAPQAASQAKVQP